MDISLLPLMVPPASLGSYGLKLRGTPPVMISHITPRSPADRGGLQIGDFLIEINGQEVVQLNDEKVWITIKHYQGSALRVRVGRPSPVPVTDTERRRAVIVLQTTLDATTVNTKQEYKATVQNAFLDVQDILGSLGGGGGVSDSNHSVQEVEVAVGYDSDSLSSPPDSSNESEGDIDDLLDFTKDDAFTHKAGTEKVGGGQEVSGAQLVKSALEAQRALENIRTITANVTEQKELKKLRGERKKREEMVSSQAAFKPGKTAEVSTTKQSRTQPEAELPPPPVRIESAEKRKPPTRIESVEEKIAPVKKPVSPTRKAPRESAEIAPVKRPVSPTRKAADAGPPPIPPYNPSGPDRFPLSNKPEYRIAFKKETHTYERVDKQEIEKIKAQETVPKFDVPLRRKKPREAIPSAEEAGHVTEPEKTRKLFAPQNVGVKDDMEIRDLSSLRAARNGLPRNVHDWRREEVGLWLKQLSPTLHKLYVSKFSQHDITGRTLIRLTDSKLRAMGISTSKHSRLLATQIAGLKIQQEASELRGLGRYKEDSDEEEDEEISYL